MRRGLVRPVILAFVICALAACDSATPLPPSDPTASAATLKKDCSDPKWREENLGLWYSVCRQPLRW
jgi:predicted small lipoprotein YifL